jgi:phage-related protein
MSDQMLENLSSLQDSFDTWNMSIGGISNSLGSLFAPALKEITSKAADAAVSFGNLIRKIVEGASGEEIQKAKEEFAASVRALEDTIKEQMPLFLETGGMLIKELCKGILEVLASHSAQILALLAAVGIAMAAISAAMSLATAGFQTIFSAGIALLGPAISTGFAALGPIISAAMTMLGTVIQTGITAIQALTAAAIAAWPVTLAILLAAALAALAVKFWPQITAWLKEMWEKVSSWAKETWPKIIKWFNDIWNNISGWFANLASKASGWITNVWNAIWGKISSWGSSFASVGKNLIEGLWNGISDKMQWIKDKIGSFCKNVTNWFKNLFGIESPSKLFKNLIGKNLALGLGEGFTDEMKSVSDEMAGSVPTEFNTPSVNADSLVYGANALQNLNHSNHANSFSNGLNANQNLSSINDNNGLISAFKQALTGMAFEIDGDKIGQMVISKVERVVFS